MLPRSTAQLCASLTLTHRCDSVDVTCLIAQSLSGNALSCVTGVTVDVTCLIAQSLSGNALSCVLVCFMNEVRS